MEQKVKDAYKRKKVIEKAQNISDVISIIVLVTLLILSILLIKREENGLILAFAIIGIIIFSRLFLFVMRSVYEARFRHIGKEYLLSKYENFVETPVFHIYKNEGVFLSNIDLYDAYVMRLKTSEEKDKMIIEYKKKVGASICIKEAELPIEKILSIIIGAI